MSDDIRIYVACLASYNSGVLHGVWIDAAQDADAIQEEVNAMLRASKFPNVMVHCPNMDERNDTTRHYCAVCKGTGQVPSAEEWAIHDYEGFYSIKLGESESFERVSELASILEQHGEAFAAYASHVGDDYATAEQFEEAYCGEWDSEEDYTEQTFRDCFDPIPEHLDSYIDWESMARDWFISDYVSAPSEGSRVYVFRRY